MRVFPEVTQQEEFDTLGSLGYEGALNDRQFNYLGSLGYTGALADRMAQASGGWIQYDEEAQNSLWYSNAAQSQYALNGSLASFDDLGTFTRAGTSYEEQSSGLLTPRGVNVPRLADYSIGARRWLMEGGVTNKCENYNANPTDLTGVTKAGDAAATLTVVDDSAELAAAGLQDICTSGMVYKLDNSAGSSVALALISGASGTDTEEITISSFVRCDAGSGDLAFVGQADSPDFSQSNYERVQFTRVPSTTSIIMGVRAFPGSVVYFILNQFEQNTIATSPIVVAGGSATRAPDLFTSDFSGFDLSGGFWVYFEGELNAVAGALDRLAYFDNGSSANRNDILYLQSTGLLSAQMYSGSVFQAGGNVAYLLGDTVKFAVRFAQDNFAFVANGATIATDTSCDFVVPDVAYIASSSVSGGSKPASLTPAKMWFAPASAYTVADMEALTA